jgi:2-C-methyl-D-erythritol 2,4-cyclodiphosphate synthase
MQDLRVGFGYDVHKLVDGRPCVLGGVVIPADKGPLGHSDADVLIHAICDALLGAANLRDIGFHFPDTNADFKNADSKELLKRVTRLIGEHGFRVMNVDSTLVLEQPKINPHVPQMQTILSSCMNTDASRVSIKATTNEKLGYVGREEGVCAYAVALIVR